ncbi:MAG: nuclear transport factor 2 family protein, partial [Bacteroidota bacterium]
SKSLIMSQSSIHQQSQGSIHIRIVQDFLRLQYEGQIEAAFQAYAHPDFQWVVSTDRSPELQQAIPWAGYAHQGKAGYEQLVGTLFGEFESKHFEVEEYYSVDNKVFAVGHFSFQHRTTKKMAESDFVSVFHFKEGKISGGQFYENTYAVAAARY